jgi:hypothetical protein
MEKINPPSPIEAALGKTIDSGMDVSCQLVGFVSRSDSRMGYPVSEAPEIRILATIAAER